MLHELHLLSSNSSKHEVVMRALKYKERCGKRNLTHFTRNLHTVARRHVRERARAHTHTHTHT